MKLAILVMVQLLGKGKKNGSLKNISTTHIRLFKLWPDIPQERQGVFIFVSSVCVDEMSRVILENLEHFSRLDHRQYVSRFLFLLLILPKNRHDAQRFLFLDQASEVVAEKFAQNFIDHCRVSLA